MLITHVTPKRSVTTANASAQKVGLPVPWQSEAMRTVEPIRASGVVPAASPDRRK